MTPDDRFAACAPVAGWQDRRSQDSQAPPALANWMKAPGRADPAETQIATALQRSISGTAKCRDGCITQAVHLDSSLGELVLTGRKAPNERSVVAFVRCIRRITS
jgi:hypothetical protein